MAATTPTSAFATYYDVLQVERGAPPERVRAAYRRLAQKYHPDKMPGNANAPRAMAAINAAYDVLKDPDRRAEHDRWIRRAEEASRPMPLEVPEAPADLWTFMHPARSWPWYLLFATLLAAVGTITAAVYLTAMPARSGAHPPGLMAGDPCRPAGAGQPACAPRR